MGEGGGDIPEGRRLWSRGADEVSTAGLPERGARTVLNLGETFPCNCKHSGIVNSAALAGVCRPLVDIQEITQTSFQLLVSCQESVGSVVSRRAIKTLLWRCQAALGGNN